MRCANEESRQVVLIAMRLATLTGWHMPSLNSYFQASANSLNASFLNL
jgi:hypothetical protein